MNPPVRTIIRATIAVVALSALISLAAAVALFGPPDEGPAPGYGPGQPVAFEALGSGDLQGATAALQRRLADQPEDHRAWSALALGYVEQARLTADPGYYPKAEQALDQAARLAPDDDRMLTGRATLAAARHDFTGALTFADRALVANPDSAQAHAVRSDALTELGRYDEAFEAVTRADRLRPSESTFARLSYQAELRGDIDEARRLMRLAQDAAATPESYAFATAHLGELALLAGDPATATRHFDAALDANPASADARVGRAQLAVAQGDVAAAEQDYLTVVRRLPLPEVLVELGELYQATGRADEAAEQFATAATAATLARSSGAGTDLETALFEADHGSQERALMAAQAEWERRQSVHTADALAWALHTSGRSAEALPYARRAVALGTPDPGILFHHGAIEAAAGDPAAARRSLTAGLTLDAGTHPLRAAQARALLAAAGEAD